MKIPRNTSHGLRVISSKTNTGSGQRNKCTHPNSSNRNSLKVPNILSSYPNLSEVIRLFQNLPTPPAVDVPALPPRNSSKKFTLVLDMDETLIHCEKILEEEYSDDLQVEDGFIIQLRLPSQNRQNVLVRKRPHLDYFLKEVSKDWEVVVFTASMPACAVPILNALDPERSVIHHRLFRDACYIAPAGLGSNYYIKNLNILGRPLDSTLLVDNSLEAFGFQPRNGLLVKTWREDASDDELLRVLKTLRKIYKNNCHVQEFIQKNCDYTSLLSG